MKVLVFGYNTHFKTKEIKDMKADIITQLKDTSGVLLIDNLMEYKGTIELSENDCKQFGVIVGRTVERGNH